MSPLDRPVAPAAGVAASLGFHFLVLGCDGGTGPTFERQLGVIVRFGDTARISVPDSALLGEPVVVSLTPLLADAPRLRPPYNLGRVTPV